MTLDWELVDLTKHHNYTDQAIQVRFTFIIEILFEYSPY